MYQGGAGSSQEGQGGQEDEWKNIQVMLNCILGMVEKTQSAISILQQRQTEVGNIRTSEEMVAEVQARASMAIMEVKQVAVEQIRLAREEKKQPDVQKESKEESCWNCGRPATETCSGCSLARYCGSFCQHKDWEAHSRICSREGQESNGMPHGSTGGGKKDKGAVSPTGCQRKSPANNVQEET